MIFSKLIDQKIRRLLDKRGYIFMRKSNPGYYLGRRFQLMQSYGINLVLDVGANVGQYAKHIRSLGYSGEVISYEPMREPYESLLQESMNDPLWSCQDFALGDANGTQTIHVSGNSISSSILPMLSEHEKHAPTSGVVAEEAIIVKRLDALPDWQLWKGQQKKVWLKIDVQGYEDKVLSGAIGCLPNITAIQLELSLRPLYAQQLLILPMMERLADLGFAPVAFEPGFSDKDTGEYLQVDGIFHNRRMNM